MRGAGHADVPFVLQMPGNKADAVPCERLRKNRCLGAADFQMAASDHSINPKHAKHVRQITATAGAGAWLQLMALYERVRIGWRGKEGTA
jgi:hypothetical protein